ncbi:ParA family protein [Singulisphaera acidiphila]|uniref:ATPase involved in chromosome partitioning n=1 Tax=Singulisphaera acidiphila (strain ATCC BAA-1392 / DSM 18658 / VKM B-2454 / MOB10) TaxID=886293 RepID=L0DRQ7_SINAD|nr:ParA family protein [Singulisphaera acidiphila]AGA31698.1 ATPase involved in chromosome partitioning [Singulisphaera acidiphila DSM 18658]
MAVLAVVNQKGGVGKTTTTAALGVLLARQGRGVHLVDMDHQADLTSAFNYNDADGQLYEALSKRGPLPVVPISDNLTLTPSSIDLARGETQFVAEVGRENLLKTCLAKAKIPADTTVLIDCPPSLGILTSNCLAVADALIVVVKPGGFEMRAFATLEELVKTYREQVNPKLMIAGFIMTEVHSRRAINDVVEEEIGKLYPLLGRIRVESELMYATSEGRILKLNRSKALEDYAAAAEKLKEVMKWD